MSKEFEGRYTVADGYAGKSRPQSFTISERDLEDDMDQDDLYELFAQLMQEAFDRSIVPEDLNATDFVEWAKGIIAEKNPNNPEEGT